MYFNCIKRYNRNYKLTEKYLGLRHTYGYVTYYYLFTALNKNNTKIKNNFA